MLVGDFLAYIDIFSVLLLLGVLSRVSTVPFLPSLDGQNTPALGQPASPKIFHFTELRKYRMRRGNPAHGRGAYRDRHDAGRAVGAWVSSARRALQGGQL
ncbi:MULTISPECIES: helicase associated domain-containing protein [unclassified Bradyrhizobium]|uniref:helicase associated domain-containing protein n=1 Tax=unclassified Bradyrhizobium TaxID=2631580 RepID=UPI001FF016F5|nr:MULTISPECIES: helicase associated domain-containing protein [unclassified Bradyrhizobium]MDN4983817.1 helicase associated domain-containing protein [Bradyrhizobium sp. WYCCWR 13022]